MKDITIRNNAICIMNHIYDLGVNYDESEMTHIVSDERWWVILITSGTISNIEIIKIIFFKIEIPRKY